MAARRSLGLMLIMALAVAGSAIGLAAKAQASHSMTFGGRAFVLEASVLGVKTSVSDTGQLPSSGGALEAAVFKGSVPGIASGKILHASTVGQGTSTRSEGSVVDLLITAGGHELAAGFVMSRAAANCRSGITSVEASSEIAGLRVDGNWVVVSGEPNQTIELPAGAGRIVINERLLSPNGIQVNALHISIRGAADVIVSSAYANITCPAPSPPPPPPIVEPPPPPHPPSCDADDFVTGGGWLTGTPSGSKANFSVGGGVKGDSLWGHLNFHEHGSKLKVKGTRVTRYLKVSSTTRRVEGTAEIDGSSGTYWLEVSDNGEPGRSDKFSLQLSNGYSASGYLGGGNIQLHSGCDYDDDDDDGDDH